MAELLKKHFAEDCNTVVRTGGDEFLVLARCVDGERVRERLAQLTREATVRINDIPVSFGYGLCEQQKDDFDDGLRRSDMALLEARNRFHGRTGSEGDSADE